MKEKKMKRISGIGLMLAVVVLAGFAPSAFAQGGTPAPATNVTVSPSPNPVSDTLRTLVARYAKNMVGAAELMPADKYDFKPTPQEITFAHLVGHIAQSNMQLCGRISGAPAPQTTPVADTDGKDKLVAAIKASFDYCTDVLSKADDSALGANVGNANRPSTRAAAMITVAYDWADHYSAQAIYLRLNGILPPSAQPATPPKM
jgi:DinB superfamily